MEYPLALHESKATLFRLGIEVRISAIHFLTATTERTTETTTLGEHDTPYIPIP